MFIKQNIAKLPNIPNITKGSEITMEITNKNRVPLFIIVHKKQAKKISHNDEKITKSETINRKLPEEKSQTLTRHGKLQKKQI